MRILFVEASSGGVVGGSLTGLYHGILGLRPRGHELGIVLYEPKAIEADLQRLQVKVWHMSRRRLPKQHRLQSWSPYRSVVAAGGLREVRLAARRTVGTLVEDLPAALRLLPILRRFRPDLVHAGNGVRANFDALLACLLARVPVVCHVKGFEKYTARERWVTPRLAGLICMTEAVRQHCVQHGITHRHCAVIYDAVDPQDFHPVRPAQEVRRELGVDPAAPLVGVVGNVQEWKGQLVFVQALARLRERFPNLRGALIGGVHRAGAEYYRAIEQFVARERLGDIVRMTGFRSDVADLVNALDIVVHTSVRPEPFGRVILEGMLLGKAVVATAAGGVPELIETGRTGMLVGPGDAAALAECLADLVRDGEKRERLGRAARQWVEQRFSLAKHVEELERFYARARKEQEST